MSLNSTMLASSTNRRAFASSSKIKRSTTNLRRPSAQ
eukprot:CAMPEP_0184107954 /NCGR_PEP_ID=MMETSP0974-20121125/16138_1 /TAXON_ID=483370 /ORGANISM="non described non described, Strain CCMP2097" /LENGTH=36 /DNA_ID= /DNA_START= /DNA_END= /DNA_ORIENTATION=